MARKKKVDIPAPGAPAWTATFSDLMNLLLCFFVLLFSMSNLSAAKMERVVQSFQETFSVLPGGGSSISQGGTLISSGVAALEQFDIYFNASTGKTGDEENEGNNGESDKKNTGSEGQEKGDEDGGTGKASTDPSKEEIKEEYEKEELASSEKMEEEIEEAAKRFGIQDQIELDFNGEYVLITMNGAILFDSGKSEIKAEADPLLEKLSELLAAYPDNMIEVEGHTDSVPIHSAKYEDNDVLSMYRALSVANFIRSHTSLDRSHIVSAGRGEYSPIADNGSAEGRALNRRVEIKVYNRYNSSEVTGTDAKGT